MGDHQTEQHQQIVNTYHLMSLQCKLAGKMNDEKPAQQKINLASVKKKKL